MALNYDYIICLTGSKIKDYGRREESKFPGDSEISALLRDDSENIDPIGTLIQLAFCCYDMKAQMVQPSHDGSYIISHPEMHISEIQLEPSRINLEKYIKDGMSLKEALQKLNDFIYQNIIRESQSFCFMTFGDDMLTKLLPQAVSKVHDLKLAPHFYQYFDVQCEFKKHLPHAVQLYTLNEMLAYTNLKNKENSFEAFAQSSCKSVVRLLNMMVTAGHTLQNPKMINSSFQSVVDNNDSRGQYINQRIQRSKKNYVRARSPSPFKNPTRGYFIRLRGLPYNTTEYEVYEFMRGIRLYKEDIAFQYDGEGKFVGEVYLRLNSEADKFEAINFNLGELDNNFIEIFETSENDWNTAKQSQYQDKRDQYNLNQVPMNSEIQVTDEQGVIKIKGVSSNTTEQDIISFFVGLKISQIRRAVIAQVMNASLFLQTKQDAHLSLTYHMEKLNQRFIEVFLSNKKEFENYMALNFVNSAPHYTKDNMPAITQEKKKNTLMVNGLPFSVTKQQIVDFFIEYDIKERDIYLLTSHSGKFSGNALISFEDELEAQRALKQKNFAYIGSRYIELFEYK